MQIYEAQSNYDDGRIRDVMFHKACFNNKDASPGGLIGVILDITEREQLEISQKQLEQTAKETERRLSNIINFLPVATMVIDSNRRVTAWKRAMDNFTGVKAESIIGKGDFEYSIPFSGERRPVIIDYVLERQAVVSSCKHISRQGDMLTAESFIPKLGENGTVFRVCFSASRFDREHCRRS